MLEINTIKCKFAFCHFRFSIVVVIQEQSFPDNQDSENLIVEGTSDTTLGLCLSNFKTSPCTNICSVKVSKSQNGSGSRHLVCKYYVRKQFQ